MKKLFYTFVALLFAITVSAQQRSTTWKAPEKYKTMKQIEKGDLATGKALYGKYCKSCHGNLGKGDGPRANMLKSPTGDFSKSYFSNFNYGELYYISFVGYGDMPNFEKKIIDESDRASIIEYMKTMKNK